MISYIAPLADISITGWLIIVLIGMFTLTAIDQTRKNTKSKKYNLPPGPKGVPILGTFPSFLKAPAHIIFDQWTKKYGNVYKFSLGTGTSVVLGDADTIREAFVSKSPDVDSRCQWRYCFIRMFRGLSVLPYCQKWINTRRRTLTILRDFGMGKSFMEDRIYEETICLMNCMLEAGKNGKYNFNPRDMLRRSPMNVLCSILFGKRYEYDHPGLLYVMNTVVYLVDFLAKASIYDILPSKLRTVAGFSLRGFHKQLDDLNKFMHDRVDEHKQSYNSRITNNFVDAWLKARDADMEKAKASDSTPPHGSRISTGEKVVSDLPDVLQDIIVAGAHSTGIVFNWCILLLTLNKEEQDKAYHEIIEMIGPDRIPSMTDRPKLRYIEAVTNEVMRIATVLPLVAHATGCDTTIGGYDVPANIEVIYNNWTLNRDEKVFPDPEVFRPSRWLKNGEIRKELLHGFFPFGIGKRSCAGEALARMNLFVTIATLIQSIEFLPPDDSAPADMKPVVDHHVGLLADCKPFLIRARRRPTTTILAA